MVVCFSFVGVNCFVVDCVNVVGCFDWKFDVNRFVIFVK